MTNLPLFQNKSFAIYGLGITGRSVLNYLKKVKTKKVITWDDNLKKFKKKKRKFFYSEIDKVDFIIISPGIDINKSQFKKKLLNNKRKIITDLDLFFLSNRKIKSVFVTGTNGKSTTCSLINHVLKKNDYKTELVGNIGRPILDVKHNEKKIYIVEVSSFQLSYSKFIKPNLALLLNITRDHLDWHKNMNNYTNAKYRLFKNQSLKEKAIIRDKKLKKIYLKKKLRGKLIFIPDNSINVSKIENDYLKKSVNKENLEFAYAATKILKVSKKSFLNTLASFKGLAHRQELFFKYKNFNFINDSKATSLESSKFALLSNKNILWIVGGLPKKNDKIDINLFQKKILKTFIIGKYSNFFRKQFKNKLNLHFEKNLKKTMKQVFEYIKHNASSVTFNILFSPASSSYDQYNNFVERGNHFKKLVKNHVKKLN